MWRLATDYRVVAGSIGAGQMLVLAGETRCLAVVQPAAPGRFEAALAGPGGAIGLFNLRAKPPASSLQIQQFRRFHAGQTTSPRLRPGKAFDAIVHVPAVAASTPLAGGTPQSCP